MSDDRSINVGRIVFPPPRDNQERDIFQSLEEIISRISSSLDVLARPNVKEVSASYNVQSVDNTVLGDATSGAITITLPPASEAQGQVLSIKKIDGSGNAVTVDGDGSETIDGATTKSLSAQYDSVTIHCDGTEWWILSEI